MRRSNATLVTLLAAAVIASCGGGEDGGAGDGDGAEGASDAGERPLSDAIELFAGGTSPTCLFCHGESGAGGMMGPALDGLAADWDVDALTQFILEPEKGVAASDRLTDLASRYSMHMPKPAGFTESDARVMARWLLEGMPR